MCASTGMTSRMNSEFYSYAKLEVSYMFHKVPTIPWMLVDVRTFLPYLYTCWVQPSLLIFSPNGIGWRFPEIYNLEIISGETFLY